MSEQTQEPTMEEILASIRRIISEDDAPASAEGETAAAPVVEAAAPEPAPAAEPEPEPEPMSAEAVDAAIEHEEDEEILELTEPVAPAETHGDLDVFAKDEPAPAPAPAPVYAPPPVRESLVSTPAASAAASSFGRLSAAVQMPSDGTTLEHVVRELLTPLLAAWLDENLPAIVQAKVDEEVERIARGRVR
jgi:cell pole-organizing protein PopZ